MPKPNFKNPIRKKRKERFQDLINARKNVKAKETALIEDYHKNPITYSTYGEMNTHPALPQSKMVQLHQANQTRKTAAKKFRRIRIIDRILNRIFK